MGEVYLAADMQMAERLLAVKLIRESTMTSDELAALKREFSILKQLYHPNIPRVFDFGHDDRGGAYYTAEYLEGRHLGSFDLRGKWRQLVEVAVQVCRALAFLHSKKLVHHDVKPENILLLGDFDDEATAKLVDFGLVSARKSGLKSVKGSPETMAPEIFQDKPHDHRVDLYALGAVLYHAATGESPFPITDLVESIKRRLSEPPPSPRKIQPDLPEALDHVITKLMAIDPNRRYQNARDVVSDLSERLGVPLEPETPETMKCYIAGGSFVAHQGICQQLCALIDDASKGLSLPGVLIRGEPGIGKSRLVRQIQTYAQLRHVPMLRTRCTQERGGTLEPVLDVIRCWRHLEEKELREIFRFGMDEGARARFDPSMSQSRVLAAVDWIEREARTDRVLLVFENIQSADSSTLDFLSTLIRSVNSTAVSVWCTLEAAKEESRELRNLLETMHTHDFRTIILLPLDEAGCKSLVDAVFPGNRFPQGFCSRLYRESGGNPLHVKLVLDTLVDQGLLRLNAQGWDFLGQLSDMAHAHDLRQLFTDRIRGISGLSRDIACLLGASAGSVRMSILCSVLNCSETDLMRHLVPMIQNGWISQYVRDGDTWTAFNHPGFCTAITSELSDQEIREIHLTIARYLENHENISDSRIQESLGYHWLKIGDPGKIARYALAAGQAMLSRLDAGAAKTLWQGSLQILESVTELAEPTREILWALADLLRDTGEHRDAIRTYQNLLMRLEESHTDQRVKCLHQIALAQDRLGETEDAKRNWLICISLLNGASHESIGGIYGGLGWLCFREGDHDGAIRYCHQGLAAMQRGERSSQKADLLNTLGTLCFYRGEIEDALNLWRKALKIRQQLNQKKGISDLHNNIGAALNALGNHRGAKWHWNRCLKLSQQLGDVERMGGIYNNLGIQAFESGKLTECSRYYEQALDIFNRLGAPRDIASTVNNLGEIALRRAEYAKAMGYWQQALEIGAELADKESQIEPMYQLGQLYLLLGEYQAAETTLAESETIANQIDASGALGSIYELLARSSLYAGESSKAKEYCQLALKRLERSGDQLKLARAWITLAEVAAAIGDRDLMFSSLNQARKLALEAGEYHVLVSSLIIKLNYLFKTGFDESQEKDIVLAIKEAVKFGASFPELMWQVHWARGRFLKIKGRLKAATEAYSQAVSILKQITKKLSDPHLTSYLRRETQQQFRHEVIALKELLTR